MGNKLDSAAGADIARMLDLNRNIAQLNLSGNVLGPKGAEWIGNGCYKNGSSLSHLTIDRNGIQERGAKALLRFWSSPHGDCLAHLDLRENELAERHCHGLCEMLGKNLH